MGASPTHGAGGPSRGPGAVPADVKITLTSANIAHPSPRPSTFTFPDLSLGPYLNAFK